MAARGAPHKGHFLYCPKKEALYVDKERTGVNYKTLADTLRCWEAFNETLATVSDKTLYKRVWNWCHNTARVSVREPNEEVYSPEVTELKARRCMGTLAELKRVMEKLDVDREVVQGLRGGRKKNNEMHRQTLLCM